MRAPTAARPDWDALRHAIAGQVLLPGTAEYERIRRPAIPRFHDVRPQAVVRCRTPEDVAEAISFARNSELAVVPRSGGHCFAGRSSTTGIVVDVRPMRAIAIGDGKATVGAGALLGEVYDALAGDGLTVPAGCGPEVGIAGLALGGGLGILGRSHGLTSDSLLEAQVVLADGRVVSCDDERHSDLFWALRGAGGGQFGIVTSLVFRTLPAPTTTGFHLAWTDDHAPAVVEAWQTWAPAAPDELAASLLITASDDADERPVANVFGALIGEGEQASPQLDELIEAVGAAPVDADRQTRSYRETKRHLVELGDAMTHADRGATSPSAGHPYSKSEFFREPLPAAAVAELVEHLVAGPSPGQPRDLDFTPWRGAYNRVPATATAFAQRDARFLLKHGIAVDPNADDGARAAARRWLVRSWEIVHPWGTGGVYPNFPDPDLDDWQRAYHGENYERLTRVKSQYDPEGLWRFAESVAGA